MSYEDLDITDDIIDTRDLVEYVEAYEAAKEDEDFEEVEWDERLLALAKECENYADDYLYGATVVADSHFEEYAEQLADDLGLVNREVGWPACHIDWAEAADALKVDYHNIEVDGYSFWVR